MATVDRIEQLLVSEDHLANAGRLKIGIVVAQWNSDITHGLRDGAVQTLVDNNVPKSAIDIHQVPGSFELIYGAHQLLQSPNRYNAIIVIGSVIRGETAHFDYVCSGVTQGIKDLNIKYNIPTIFCVLTDDNRQQSIDRSGGKLGNKGSEAAIAAIEMALFNRF